jgi:hypothetical protein
MFGAHVDFHPYLYSTVSCDSLNLEDQVPIFISRGRVAQVYASSQSHSQNCLTTDGQSASVSSYQATIWEPRPIFLFSKEFVFGQLQYFFPYYGAPSFEERSGLLCFSQTAVISPL